MKCRYCHKKLDGPCENARMANACANAPDDIRFTDIKPRGSGDLRKWRGAFNIPPEQ